MKKVINDEIVNNVTPDKKTLPLPNQSLTRPIIRTKDERAIKKIFATQLTSAKSKLNSSERVGNAKAMDEAVNGIRNDAEVVASKAL